MEKTAEIATMTALSPRIARLRERVLARGGAAQGVPGYRAWASMLAHEKYGARTWGQYRAYMLLALVEIAPLGITQDERLVGEHLFSDQAMALDFPYPWRQWGEEAEKQLAATSLPEEVKAQIADFFRREQVWRESPYVRLEERRPEMALSGFNKGIFVAGGWTENHSIRDFAKVARLGFRGIRREVEDAMAACDLTDPEYAGKTAFWKCALAVCDAGIWLGQRYAEEARRQAAFCADPQQRAELAEIAEVCERVPEYGAWTLREAIQAIWFAHMLTCAEDHINANSLGRLDQILYPYYERDLEAGHLTREEAIEWMEELACKLYRDYDVQQICLAGQTPEGREGCNEMTYIILEATERLDFIRCLSVRLHRGSPRRLLRQCGRMLIKGGGIPFFFLDERIVQALAERGIPRQDALDYAPIGCVEITIPGKATSHAVSGALNAAKCLELALNDGLDPLTGRQVGPHTGAFAEFDGFAALVAAYKAQVEYFTQLIVNGCNYGQQLQIERGPLPCLSTLTDDCIQRGRDLNDGGARYNYHSIMFFGAPNVADSLYALKRFVYDERAISPAELLAALHANFQGYEPLRQRLLHAPKYGNDQPGVDALAAMAAAHFCDYLTRFRAPFGGFYVAHLFTFLWHLDFGRATGATPDGRRAGEPLAYSLSPQQGRDRQGLTAMMSSLARIPHEKAAGSSSAIIEIDPSLVHDEGVFADILAAAIEMGIGQMQFNVTTAAHLELARRDPEHYGNIAVRVSGYSSKFCLLTKELQDHIIARTKHKR